MKISRNILVLNELIKLVSEIFLDTGRKPEKSSVLIASLFRHCFRTAFNCLNKGNITGQK